MNESFFRSLYRIRRVEEEVARIYPSDKIKSPVHLSIGQEAASVGVCAALRQDDIVFGSYRCHALYMAKGGNLKEMIAELYGKDTGCARGKGGSMHLINVKAGVMGASAVVGTQIPHAVGFAYALKCQKKDNVVALFFGDGAVDEGVLYESMNFAALKKVPVLFVCENNLYSIHSHQQDRHPQCAIWERPKIYGIPSQKIENDNMLQLYETTKNYVAEMRDGGGPRFIEYMTYRWKEHVGPNDDFNAGYRSVDEAKQWLENDQLERFRKMLAPETRQKIEKEIETEIEEAFQFAEESPFPADEELYTDLHKES